MVSKLTTEEIIEIYYNIEAIVSIHTVNFSKMARIYQKKKKKKYFIRERALPVEASPPKQHQQQQKHIVL